MVQNGTRALKSDWRIPVENIGKYGEYRVLAVLLERDVEAYLAIKDNQKDYDITAILGPSKVVRIQVKSTELDNKSNNNSINRIDEMKAFDFLVIVIFDGMRTANFYVLTKDEAIAAKGEMKRLSVTRQESGKFYVKDEIYCHKDCWEKILTA